MKRKMLLPLVLVIVMAAGQALAFAGDLVCNLALDRGKLLVSPKQTAVLRVTLAAPELTRNANRPPVNIGIVLDTSGSMRGTKLDKAKEGAIEALRRLGKNDRFSVVVYNSAAQVLVHGSDMSQVNQAMLTIGSLNSGGSTALFAGVSHGASEMRKFLDSHNIHRLILLSDGMANVGPDSPEELGRLGMALSKEGIAVATVGLGDDYNEDLMTRLSQSSEGNTYYVENSVDLPRIFQKELGDVLNVYAQDLEINLEFPANVRPIAVLGREGRIREQRLSVPLKQIYGGQEKFVLVEVEVLDAKHGEFRQLAQAAVNYQPVDAVAPKIARADVTVPFTAIREEVYASKNKAVQRDYVLMENTVSVDRALELEKQGKSREAALELRQSAQKMELTAKENKDDALLDRAAEIERFADEIESQNLGKRRRKMLKTTNYQEQIQQAPVLKPKPEGEKKVIPKTEPKSEPKKKDKSVPVKKVKEKQDGDQKRPAAEPQSASDQHPQAKLRVEPSDLGQKPPRNLRVLEPGTGQTAEPPAQLKREPKPGGMPLPNQQIEPGSGRVPPSTLQLRRQPKPGNQREPKPQGELKLRVKEKPVPQQKREPKPKGDGGNAS